MTEEKQGAAEWLRGIIDECDAGGMRSCVDIAEVFGIGCKHERTCRDCKIDMMKIIADRIEADRDLPEGIEWPRFEDGGLVNVGSEVELEGETMLVCEVALDADGWALWCENDGLDGRLRGSYCKRVKRPVVPKVLDADGVPIKVGDTVWATYNGCKHIVMAVCSDGSLHPEMVTDDGCMVEYEEGLWDFAKKVTHERPDSWERLSNDAKMGAVTYADRILGVDTRETTTEEDYEAFARDIVRRAKALAKADSEARGVE